MDDQHDIEDPADEERMLVHLGSARAHLPKIGAAISQSPLYKGVLDEGKLAALGASVAAVRSPALDALTNRAAIGSALFGGIATRSAVNEAMFGGLASKALVDQVVYGGSAVRAAMESERLSAIGAAAVDTFRLVGLAKAVSDATAESAWARSIRVGAAIANSPLGQAIARVRTPAAASLLGTAGLMSQPAVQNYIAASKAMGIADRYILPSAREWPKITSLYEQTVGSSAFATLAIPSAEFQRTAMAMKTPWLDPDAAERSVLAVAGLTAIRRAVVADAPFSKRVVSGLRSALGDWRGVSEYPQIVVEDSSARQAFYADQGFDNNLTTLPLPAFEASLAGPSGRPLSVEAVELPLDEDAAQNARAYAQIYTLESKLRALIIRVLTDLVGPNWMKQRIHRNTIERWEERYQRHAKAGRPEHGLLFFADLSELGEIIVNNANWSNGFEKIFGRKESVQESFYRLGPLRNCVAHSRPLEQEDLIYLFVEASRLMKAIKRSEM